MKELTHIINVHLPDVGVLAQSRVARPGFANAAHRHDQDCLLFVIAGQGQIEYKDGLFDLNANSVVTLKRHFQHRLIDRPRKQMTVFSIYFDCIRAELNNSIADHILGSKTPFTLPLYYAEQIRRNLRQILYEQAAQPQGYKIALRQLLNLTLLLIYRADLDAIRKPRQETLAASAVRVQEVLDYAARNYYEPISLPDAARLAGLSQRQFSSLCKSLCGQSFVHYSNRIRTCKAKELLAVTDTPVSAIAFKVGYEDLSTFYRAFKKHQQISPLSIRRTQ